MGVLPRPQSRALVGFGELAVDPLGVDEGHVAVILLGRLVEHREDTLRARESHDNAVELLADLCDRLAEALVERQEADKAAERDSEEAADRGREHAARDRAEYVADVAHLGVDRHENICEHIGVVGAVEKGVVELIELLNALFLVVENLDDLLTLHHLLDVAVLLAEVDLLREEILAALAADFLCYHHHRENHSEGDESKRYADHKHARKNRNDRDRAREYLRHTLADHLAKGVNVVGVDAHDVAVRVGVKILDWKALHVFEDITAQIAHGALSDVNHYSRISVGCCRADQIERRHAHDCENQRSEIGCRLREHRHDVVVDQVADKESSLNAGEYADYDADEYYYQMNLVVLEN